MESSRKIVQSRIQLWRKIFLLVIAIVYVLISLTWYIYPVALFHYGFGVIGAIGFLFVFPLKKHEGLLVLMLLFFLILGSVNMIIFDYFRLSIYLPITMIGVSLVFKRVISIWPLLLFYLLSFITISFGLFIVFQIEIIGIDPQNVLYFSRNFLVTIMLSLFLLITLCFLAANSPERHSFILLTTGLLCIVIMMLFTGRMGLIAAILMVLGLLLFYQGFTVVCVLLAVGLYLTFSFSIEIIHQNAGIGIGRFFEKGIESERWVAWRAIIFNLEFPINLLGFKANLSKQLSGISLHNIFFEVYGYYGAIGFTFAVVSSIQALFRSFVKSRFLFLVLLGVILRANLYTGFSDPLMVAPIITAWLLLPKSNKGFTLA